VRTARKHIGWYVRGLPQGEAFRAEMNRLEGCETQLAAVADYFDQLALRFERLPDMQACDDGAGQDDLQEEAA